MACVRRAITACVHAPGCPHDIGPAAAGVANAVNAAAHLSPVEGVLADRAQAVGCGPVERRAETPAERLTRHAREHPSWEPPASSGSVPMHIPRPRQLRPVTPSQQRPQEDPVPVADQVPIPCGTCLHEPVCALKPDVRAAQRGVDEVRELSAAGLRLVVTAYRVECDHHLASVIAPPALSDALDEAVHPEPTAAERVQSSRQRGAAHLRKATDEQLCDAIRAHAGNRSAAAASLGMTTTTVTQRVRAMRELPADVAALLAARPSFGRKAAAA